MGYCPCCAKASHVAVPPTFERGAFSPIREFGMSPWAVDGFWRGRRLAAVYYVLHCSGAPLPVHWDLGTRSLEFIARGPLIRSISNGLSVPTPTIAEAEEQKQCTKADLDLRSTSVEPRQNSDTSDTPEARPFNEGD